MTRRRGPGPSLPKKCRRAQPAGGKECTNALRCWAAHSAVGWRGGGYSAHLPRGLRLTDLNPLTQLAQSVLAKRVHRLSDERFQHWRLIDCLDYRSFRQLEQHACHFARMQHARISGDQRVHRVAELLLMGHTREGERRREEGQRCRHTVTPHRSPPRVPASSGQTAGRPSLSGCLVCPVTRSLFSPSGSGGFRGLFPRSNKRISDFCPMKGGRSRRSAAPDRYRDLLL